MHHIFYSYAQQALRAKSRCSLGIGIRLAYISDTYTTIYLVYYTAVSSYTSLKKNVIWYYYTRYRVVVVPYRRYINHRRIGDIRCKTQEPTGRTWVWWCIVEEVWYDMNNRRYQMTIWSTIKNAKVAKARTSTLHFILFWLRSYTRNLGYRSEKNWLTYLLLRLIYIIDIIGYILPLLSKYWVGMRAPAVPLLVTLITPDCHSLLRPSLPRQMTAGRKQLGCQSQNRYTRTMVRFFYVCIFPDYYYGTKYIRVLYFCCCCGIPGIQYSSWEGGMDRFFYPSPFHSVVCVLRGFSPSIEYCLLGLS